MKKSLAQYKQTRLGFHYHPDTLHYRESDLAIWLPKIRQIRASWIVLEAPKHTAIPEKFLNEFMECGIHPIIHFNFPLYNQITYEDANLLFHTYARWGIRFVVLYNQPNSRLSWSPSQWIQTDLVERFLDIFLPLADLAHQSGLIPIFPPLEPGGDYWDTAFLQDALKAIIRRNHQKLLDSLALGAYAYATDPNRSPEWGAGGPERWPEARPYSILVNQQDQIGFMIYDWYLAISKAILGKSLPIMLFGVGKQQLFNKLELSENQKRLLAITQLCNHNPVDAKLTTIDTAVGKLPILPPQVIACNLWGLVDYDSNDDNDKKLPITPKNDEPLNEIIHMLKEKKWGTVEVSGPQPKADNSENFSIHHYLLLPVYEWGISEWHLEAARPFIMKHQPTIGFSLEEAEKASHVTVVGGEQAFPEEQIERLRRAGCMVNRIDGDGTRIATKLEAL